MTLLQVLQANYEDMDQTLGRVEGLCEEAAGYELLCLEYYKYKIGRQRDKAKGILEFHKRELAKRGKRGKQ